MSILRRRERICKTALFANRAFLEMTRLTAKDLIGRRVSSFFALDANNWLIMAERAGMEGKSFKDSFHDVYLDCDFEVTAYPVIGPGFCAFTFQRIEAVLRG